MTTETFFAIGTTLANMVNIESTYGLIANVLPDARILLTGLVRRRSLSGLGRHDGWSSGVLRVGFSTQTEMRAFMNGVFSGYTTPSASVYMTLIDEEGYYSPFSVVIDKPAFSVANSELLRGIEFPLTKATIQTANKTGNFTVTTSTRHLTADTSGGSITFALPAVAGVTANTVFSFVKTSASNTMTLDPNASETINGASTYAVTANYSRVDVYSNGSQWIVL